MLRNHGLLTLGSRCVRGHGAARWLCSVTAAYSIADAFKRMYFIDMAFKIQVRAPLLSPSLHSHTHTRARQTLPPPLVHLA